MSSFPRFWKNIERLKLPEEELMKFIDIFEEGEEILKKCEKKDCHLCSGVIPNLLIIDGKIYPTYEPCKMYYVRRTKEKLKEFIIEIPYNKNFLNFEIDENLEPAVNMANLYLKKELYKKGNGIYFYGSVGSGKTHLAFAILNEINQKTEYYSFAIFVPEFVQKIRDYYSNGEVEFNPIIEIAKIPILLIDDLGAERYTEWVQEQIVQLLDYRYRNKLATIITSNLKLNDLKEKVGERIFSRVVGLSKPILVISDDKRKKEQNW
jgi:DNA replication protein DnaC